MQAGPRWQSMSGASMRYGIYYTSSSSSQLHQAAVGWLGRDAFDGREIHVEHGFSRHTVAPARYGFHGTLKAPFRLHENASEDRLIEVFQGFSKRIEPVTLPNVELGRLGAFFALVPSQPCEALKELGTACVEIFEPFRAQLSDEEIARRKPEKLTARQRDNLHRRGYPYIGDEFRFHLTLTGEVPDKEAGEVEKALRRHFAAHIGQPLTIGTIAVSREAVPGEPFRVLDVAELGIQSKTIEKMEI